MAISLEDNFNQWTDTKCVLPIYKNENDSDVIYLGQVMMENYFTLLDHRPQEAKPDALNQVGIAICKEHKARLKEIGILPSGKKIDGDPGSAGSGGVDGGMVAAILIGIIILGGCGVFLYKRR